MKSRVFWTVIALGFLLTSAGAAQFKVAWQRTNNFEWVDFDGLDTPIVKVDDRGNVYIAGVARRVEATGAVFDYVVLKRAADGRLLWQTHLPLEGQGGVRALELDRFGNAYITGWGGTAKFIANGRVAWFIPFGDREDGWKDFQDIGVDFAGNVYVTGHSLRDRNSLSTVSITTIKYSPSGTQRWLQHYAGGFIYWSPSYQRLCVDPLGNVYVAGSIRPQPGSGEEWAIIKYNSLGHEIWTRSYNRGGFDMAHDIALDRRGRHELSIPLAHEPSTMDVDHFGRLVVTSPESTSKFISR